MIAVVHPAELPVTLVLRYLILFGKFRNALVEVVFQLLFGYSAYIEVGLVHRDIFQIVQPAEDAHLPELRHAGEEYEANIFVFPFYHAVKPLQLAAHLLCQFLIVDIVDNRLLVFVDKKDHLLPRLLAGCVYHGIKPRGRVFKISDFPVFGFPFPQMKLNSVPQVSNGSILAPVQVEPEHGVCVPFLFELFHRKPFEEFLLAAEVRVHRGDKETLSEPSRAAEKIVFTCRSKAVDLRSLVDIYISSLADF